MRRLLFLTLISSVVAGPALGECDLRSIWRGQNAVDYIPKARACLDAPRSGIWFDIEAEAKLLTLVNEERESRGLNLVELRPALLEPARIHSFDMAQESFFDHEGEDGRVASGRVAALDRTLIYSEIRENIARIGGDLDYRDTAQIFHNILMDSEGHRRNILAENLTHVAIGIGRTEKGAWVTQVFVRQEGELAQPLQESFSSEEPLTADATLDAWDVRAYAVRDREGAEYELGQRVEEAREDLRLVVVGGRYIDERRSTIIKMIGPDVTPLLDQTTPAPDSNITSEEK